MPVLRFNPGRPAVLLVAALLTACASQPPGPEPADTTDREPAVRQPAPEPPPVRNFPTESLYQLLRAEFAGIGENIAPALEIYLEQAHQTRDPGVIRRAVRIASYLDRNDAVLDLARLWVEVEPRNVEVRRLLAFQLARAGRVVEAFSHGEFLLGTGDHQALQSLAAFARDASQEDQRRLLTLYRELKAEHPDNPGLLLGEAMLLRQMDRLEDSLATTRTLLRHDPDNESGLLLQAQLLDAQGRRDEALEAIRHAVNRLPDNKRLRLQYARLLSEEDLPASREQMATLAEKFPDDADILFSLALANKELERYQQARSQLRELVDRHKRVNEAHYQLGRIAEARERPEEAVYQYRQVRKQPHLLPATARLVELLAEHGSLGSARDHLNELRLGRPDLRDQLFQLEAELLIERDRLDDAWDLLATALARDPDNTQLLYTRSIVGAEQGDLAAAEKDLRAILQREPDNANALNALGYTMTTLSDRYEEAQALIEQALALDPDNPAILDSLGWVYYKTGREQMALNLLRRAFNDFPDAEVAAHLGEVLWKTGSEEEALSVWRKGLTQDPEDDTLLETLERLAPGRLEDLLERIAESEAQP